MQFTFGSDPEFILVDESGRPRSAIGIVPGGKGMLKEGVRFFHDNVLAECNVKPAESPEGAVENFGRALRIYSEMVRPYKITALPSACFDEAEISHPEARRAGCSPESCAYSLKEISNKRVKKSFRKNGFRTAGGHMHLGGVEREHEQCVMMVRLLDLFVGIPTLIVDSSPEGIKRRKLYGKPGRYRTPEHGLEYRTPGNFWLSSPELVRFFFDACAETLRLHGEGIHEELWEVDREALDSDDFWNAGGDPSKCHVCKGYDVGDLRSSFDSGCPDEGILSLVRNYSPGLIERAVSLSRASFDMYEEWSLN
jgi:hypothetical protein